MTHAHPPKPAKLIVAMIAAKPEWFDCAVREMEREFGPADLRSDAFPFDITHYYDAEMGSGLLRQIAGFERLIDPSELAGAKLFTNCLESALAAELDAGVARPVNLDPGYVTEAKLVLASAKDFAHRVYLRDGVYAEATLRYDKAGRWQHFPWTFPDFRSGRYDEFLLRVREMLRGAK